jgi:transcriptional regulator with XRE-family HTH domain
VRQRSINYLTLCQRTVLKVPNNGAFEESRLNVSNNVQLEDVIPKIKQLLKGRGLSYSDVAIALSLSESSVKKLFMGSDISLSRVLKICELLEIDLIDVLADIKESPLQKFKFTKDQEDLLYTNDSCFNLYWMLVIEEIKLFEIKSQFGVDNKYLYPLLRELDRLDLIKWINDENIKTPAMDLILWENSGKLVHKLKRTWPQRVFDKAIKNEKNDDYKLGIRYLKLSNSSYKEFNESLEDLILEFGKRSVREMRHSGRENLKPVSFAFSLIPESYVSEL